MIPFKAVVDISSIQSCRELLSIVYRTATESSIRKLFSSLSSPEGQVALIKKTVAKWSSMLLRAATPPPWPGLPRLLHKFHAQKIINRVYSFAAKKSCDCISIECQESKKETEREERMKKRMRKSEMWQEIGGL